MSSIRELDTVALRRPQGQWVAGTTGAVVDTYHDQALVELVGPDGATVDLLTVALDDLTLLPRPGSHRGQGTDRLAS